MNVSRDHLGGQTLWMALLNACCLVIGVVVGVGARFGLEALPGYLIDRIDGWLFFCGSIILVNYIAGTYGIQLRVSRFNLVVNWAFSLLVGILVVSMTSYAWFQTLLGRGTLLWAMGIYSILWLFMTIVLYRFILASPVFAYRVAIIGTGELATGLRQMVENEFIRPVHRVSAFVSLADRRTALPAGSETIDGVAAIHVQPDTLTDVLRSLGVHVIIIGIEPQERAAVIYPQLRRLRFEGVLVLNALTATEIYNGRIPLDLIDESWLTEASMATATPVTSRFKRFVDLLTSFIGVALALPVALAIAALIRVSAPRSPVFYSQTRVGRFGTLFRMYKFRTMVDQAEAKSGVTWSPDGDARITRLGSILRRFRLDELPQLINVIRGEMSIVGPRPERPELVADLERRIPYYRERENVLPGLTGWAQIRYPYGSSVEDARRKLEFDMYYIKNLSVTLDLRIILRTVRIVLFGMERYVR